MDRTLTILMIFALMIRNISSSHQDESRCNKEIVDTCLIPLKEVDYKVSTAVVPHLDKATLRDHCRRYSMFESCMDDVRPYCSRTKQLIYKGLEDAYSWMCKDGLNEYMNYIDCFNNKELHSEGEMCNSTLTQSLQKMKQNNYDSSYKMKHICLYLQQYLDCVQNVVEAFCGNDAALWQRTLDEKSILPVLDAINCRITVTQKPTQISWIKITIGATLTLSLFMIVITVVLVYFQKCKRRQSSSSRNRPAVPVAPPPYEEPLPFIVYGNNMALTSSEQAGPMPKKIDLGLTGIPVPPYTEEVSSSAMSRQEGGSGDEAVDTGYFGATASGISMSQEAQDVKVEPEEKTEDEISTLHRRDNASSDITGISNPVFEELAAVGYFGATAKPNSSE